VVVAVARGLHLLVVLVGVALAEILQTQEAEQQILVAVVEEFTATILVVMVVQGLLFSATHQTTTWLQQAEQSPTWVVTRCTRSQQQVITRWWLRE
jgi:hypothetical protein